MNDEVKVIYVMGLWRSGSTVLDTTLGNSDGVVSVGELRNLPLLGWEREEICSCGKAAQDCEFWRAVRTTWEQRVGGSPISELIFLQDHYERLRVLPKTWANRLLKQARFRRYGELLYELFRSIRDISGKRCVVDSTKYPVRALALGLTPGLDTRFLHLVRDGRAVVWSYMRKANTDLDGVEIEITADKICRQITYEWLKTNLACELVKAVTPAPSIRVRYEDFVSDCPATLTEIGDFCGENLDDLIHDIEANTPLEAGHGIAGNRVRWKGPLLLRADFEWQNKLSTTDRTNFWRRAGWLARRYKYERR